MVYTVVMSPAVAVERCNVSVTYSGTMTFSMFIPVHTATENRNSRMNSL